MRKLGVFAIFALLSIFAFLVACSDDEKGPAIPRLPAPTIDLNNSGIYENYVYVKFDHIGKITNYELQYSSNGGNTWSNMYNIGQGDGYNYSEDGYNYYYVSNIYGEFSGSYGNTYLVRARVQNVGGWSDWSNTASFTITNTGQNCSTPSAPQSRGPEISNNKVILNFAVSENVGWTLGSNYYEIKISTNEYNWYDFSYFNGYVSDEYYYEYDSRDKFWEISGLNAGTYYFRVRVKNNCGNWSSWTYTNGATVAGGGSCEITAPVYYPDASGYWDPAEWGEQGPPTVSFIFTSGVNTNFSTREVDVKINNGNWAPLNNYDFYRAEWVYEEFGINNAYSFDIENPTPGTTYQLRVRVKNACNEWSDWGTSGSVAVPAAATIPNAPTIDFSNSDVYEDWVYVLFYYSGNITGYELKYSSNGGTTWNDIPYIYTDAESIYGEISGSYGNTYLIKARVQNVYGWSDWSNTASFTIPGEGGGNCPTTAPVNHEYDYWGEYGESVAYFLYTSSVNTNLGTREVEVKINNGNWTTLNNYDFYRDFYGYGIDDNAYWFDITNPIPGATYQIRVRVRNACDEWSDWGTSGIVNVPN